MRRTAMHDIWNGLIVAFVEMWLNNMLQHLHFFNCEEQLHYSVKTRYSRMRTHCDLLADKIGISCQPVRVRREYITEGCTTYCFKRVY